MTPTPRFCSQCGSDRILTQVPPADERLRAVCQSCATVHYVNPKIVVGALPVWGDQVLLCKRAIEPRRGLWTLPAGFMEEGESLEAGAMRETLEEANARIALDSLYTVISLPDISQVYMLFRARLLDLDFSAGAESLDVRLFSQDQVPWDALAFATIRETLAHYFAEKATGQFTLRLSTLTRPPRTS